MNRTRLAAIAALSIVSLMFFVFSTEGAEAACPASPQGGLPDFIEPAGEEFCVFYDEDDTTLDQATRSGTHTADYWQAYVDEMGFPAPEYADDEVKFHVRLKDALEPGDNVNNCNGSVGPGDPFLNTFDECDANATLQPQMYMNVHGHELYHQVQLSDPTDGDDDPDTNNFDALWFHEGTARSMEDKVFENVDHWPNALSAPFSYNKEVNEYMAAANNDVTSDGMRYESALWWTYYSEQCGANIHETRRGVDAFGQLWTSALTADDIAALNNALSALGCTNFDTMFTDFAAALWMKDLAGLVADKYNFDDEDEAGNPAPYGPLTPVDGGTIDTSTDADFPNQAIARYGAKYFKASPHATNCPVITADFHNDGAGPAFYHVITDASNILITHVQGSGADWTQSFLNNGITTILAVAGSTNASSQVDVNLSCADPVIDVKLPNSVALAYAGPFDDPGKILAQVLVTNGDPKAPVVAGLIHSDFGAEINGVPATITSGGFIQEQYWLVIQAPNQGADGTYDLEVSLDSASDTEASSVLYDSDNLDYAVVIDRSGSMLSDGKMDAAIDAANFYVDITRDNDGLAVVPYNHDVNPAPFPMTAVSGAVRAAAKGYIDALTASGATSIGDGMDEAVNQRAGSPTGNTVCSFVLLSDGMENSSLFWADVEAAVIATGCPVTSIAFGPASDETLMQDIATATGGISFYNDVFVSLPGNGVSASAAASAADMELQLGSIYEFAQSEAERRERLAQEQGVAAPQQKRAHKVMVDKTVNEAIFSLDWPDRGVEMELTLTMPDGTTIDHGTLPQTFRDNDHGHQGWRIPKPMEGIWTMNVFNGGGGPPNGEPYQVIASGHTSLTFELLLHDVTGARSTTGQDVPLNAFLSTDSGPAPGANVMAIVTAPDGTQTTVPMHDDGQHGDGRAADGFYAGMYTAVNKADAVEGPGEEGGKDPPPKDEAAYMVRAIATHPEFMREALGAFSVLEGRDDNGNRLPDVYEQDNGITDIKGDPDMDNLDNTEEYQRGTDPNNSDTDGGGEQDGSEVGHQEDPLNPNDDKIEAPDFLKAAPGVGEVKLTYDVKRDYQQMTLWQATSPGGPWILRNGDVPLDGMYTDLASNGVKYYYKIAARNEGGHISAWVFSEGVMPSTDPIPPEAVVILDGGAPSTADLSVMVSYAAELEATESFDDITEVMLSNDPSFAGAAFKPFVNPDPDPWMLDPATTPGTIAQVYARFRDANGNESIGTSIGAILYDPGAAQGPNLDVPDLIPAFTGVGVTVPVIFTSNGNSIVSTSFSLDFDESNLSLDPTDADSDGIPDSISFTTPPGFNLLVADADLSDTDGELEFVISDIAPPFTSLPDGAIVEIAFTVTGEPAPGTTIVAPIVFANDPPASFGDPTGTDVPGTTSDGSVEISQFSAGDCNGDGVLDAADITSEVLEILDEDGTLPEDAPGSTFAGTPACDSNEDGSIGAADITCTVLLLLGDTCGDGGSVEFGGLTHNPLRSAKLELSDGNLVVSNIGSSGEDGVSVELPDDAMSMTAEFMDPDPRDDLPIGAYMEMIANSNNAGGKGPAAADSLAVARVTKVDKGALAMSAGFPILGTTNHKVELSKGGNVVATVDVGTSVELTLPDWPIRWDPWRQWLLIDHWIEWMFDLPFPGPIQVGEQVIPDVDGILIVPEKMFAEDPVMPTVDMRAGGGMSSFTIVDEVVELMSP